MHLNCTHFKGSKNSQDFEKCFFKEQLQFDGCEKNIEQVMTSPAAKYGAAHGSDDKSKRIVPLLCRGPWTVLWLNLWSVVVD